VVVFPVPGFALPVTVMAYALPGCGAGDTAWTVAQAEAIDSVRGLPVRVRECHGRGQRLGLERRARYPRLSCVAGRACRANASTRWRSYSTFAQRATTTMSSRMSSSWGAGQPVKHERSRVHWTRSSALGRSFARRERRGSRARPQRITLTGFGSVSGQRSNDRGERVGRAGAEDEVGEADLLLSPLDFLGCRRGVSGEDGQ
jgi:hypothetical protein